MLLNQPAVRAGNRPDRNPSMPDQATSTLDDLLAKRARFLAFVALRVDDRALAEDILQAAYVRALQGTHSLREQQSAVTDHFRRRRTETSALERWTQELALEGPANSQAHDLICGCIEHVLPSLRPAYAEILREVDLAEEPLATYAARHRPPPATPPSARIAPAPPSAASSPEPAAHASSITAATAPACANATPTHSTRHQRCIATCIGAMS
jgi:DNA-directed RNA polymerase specialized sigma24 family protein